MKANRTGGIMATGLVAAVAVFGIAQAGRAQTRTWDGDTSTSWTNVNNWAGSTPPGDGEDVLIPSGTPNQANIPAGAWPAAGRYGSFTVASNATVICLGDTTVTNEASGGGVGGDGKIHGIGVTILCAAAAVHGTLSADNRGFPSQSGPGGSYAFAGHGGIAAGDRGQTRVYGSVRQPTALGSGAVNAVGGGAIKVSATGTITVNGTVSANGATQYWTRSGGSGGSVWLDGVTLAGNGAVRARGGDFAAGLAGEVGGGGGGRIALTYTSSTFSGSVSAAGGKHFDGGKDKFQDGQAGSLWEPGKVFPASGTLVQRESYRYYFPNTNTLHAWNLTVSNAWFEVHHGCVAVSNLTLIDGIFRFDDASRPYDGYPDMTNFSLAGDVLLTNRTGYSELHLPAGSYSLGSLDVNANCSLFAGGNPSVTNEASGGGAGKPHGVGVTLQCASVRVATGGRISAYARGFALNSGPGYTTANSGAAHGGNGYLDTITSTYGNLARPTALGSSKNDLGGGALTLLVDGTLCVDGTITADGYVNSDVSTGSGGSLWLVADTLSGAGTGLISAKGGDAWWNRPGGGGRIALDYVTSTFAGTVTVKGGIDNGGEKGRRGTIFQMDGLTRGSASLATAAPSLATAFSVVKGTSGVLVRRNVSAWSASRMIWTDQSADATATNALANAATYTVTNLPPLTPYGVLTNGATWLAKTNSTAAGTLTLANVPLNPDVTVEVASTARGTLIAIR